jgi:hypothetical protein
MLFWKCCYLADVMLPGNVSVRKIVVLTVIIILNIEYYFMENGIFVV